VISTEVVAAQGLFEEITTVDMEAEEDSRNRGVRTTSHHRSKAAEVMVTVVVLAAILEMTAETSTTTEAVLDVPMAEEAASADPHVVVQ